jgi:hypothetical protein
VIKLLIKEHKGTMKLSGIQGHFHTTGMDEHSKHSKFRTSEESGEGQQTPQDPAALG